jgi:hypothetical protein
VLASPPDRSDDVRVLYDTPRPSGRARGASDRGLDVRRDAAGDERKPVAAFVPGTVVCLEQGEAGH